MSKRKLTYKDFKNYFSNHLQKKDKHDFEREMMRDAFEEEAFEGLSELSAEELESDIEELKSNIQNRTKKTRRIVPVWFRYAASVLVLVGVGLTILFLNTRYWQNSMLKEQVSHEMEKADSMIIKSDQAIQEAKQIVDSIKEKPEELIAESKERKVKNDYQPGKQVKVPKEKIELTDLDVAEDDYEKTDEEVVPETLVFEDEEEIVEEEVFAMKSEAQVEGEVVAEELNLEASPAMDEKVEITETAKKSSEIRIRGVSSQSKDKSPLYVIDGKPVDVNNTKTIEGKIISSDDHLAIPGVSVTLKDMEVFGTVTDINGEFSITIPSDEELKTLIASFVGMQTQEISLENDSNLLVYMDSEMLEIDEVVVTAYGVDRKQEAPVRVSAKAPGLISRTKFKKQVIENINYQTLSGFSGKYKIKVEFKVSENGSLSGFNFKNVPDVSFSNEIIRVIKELGTWTPATENDINIESKVKLTLKIEIE